MADPVAQSAGYTRQQFTVLVVLGTVNFLSALVYSIQAPFYPAEAEKKGATASVYGLVFGCYELTTFLICPIFGAYLHLVGPKFAFNIGVFVAGSSVIMFGFLDRFNDSHTFIILSFVLRISEAIGSSAVFISIYTFVTIEFPGSVATTFGLIETIFGFGLCIGPAVGAALYSVGGANAFTFPFVVLGGLLFLSALITMCMLPNLKSKAEDEKADDAAHMGLWKMLQLPEVMLYACSMVAACMGNSFLSATLEPHLRQFQLSSTMYVGFVFLLYGGTQALATPLWGMVLDKIKHCKAVTLAGSLLILTGYLLIGPAPFFDMKPKLWVTCVGLAMFGNGLGAIFVSCFVLSLDAARKGGFPDNLRTYGLVSGLWRSTLALGAFAGPSVAGVLYDNYGFRNETMFIVGVQAIMIVFILGFITKDHFSMRQSYYSMMRPPNPRDPEEKSETTPLTHSAQPPPYETYDRQEPYNPQIVSALTK